MNYTKKLASSLTRTCCLQVFSLHIFFCPRISTDFH